MPQPQQNFGQRATKLARTIVRPFSSALANLMRATGRTYNQTHHSGAGGGIGDSGEGGRTSPRRKQRRGRRHGGRR